MKDFIFLIGTSGIGKTTLAKGLFEHYSSTYIEQNMIPEFVSRDGVEDMTGELEEYTCWENVKAMLFCFHNLGYKNVIACDFDDLRTRDIPSDFKGYKFVTIKLVCHDIRQLQNQMKNRPNNGLIDYELQEKCNQKNVSRPLLPNEHLLDVTGLTVDGVLQKATQIIDNHACDFDYDYQKLDKSYFYSWVFSNGLR